jgi:hypothetical protein
MLSEIENVVRDKKSGFWEPPEPRTVPTYDLDGIAIRIPVYTIPDQGMILLDLA